MLASHGCPRIRQEDGGGAKREQYNLRHGHVTVHSVFHNTSTPCLGAGLHMHPNAFALSWTTAEPVAASPPSCICRPTTHLLPPNAKQDILVVYAWDWSWQWMLLPEFGMCIQYTSLLATETRTSAQQPATGPAPEPALPTHRINPNTPLLPLKTQKQTRVAKFTSSSTQR